MPIEGAAGPAPRPGSTGAPARLAGSRPASLTALLDRLAAVRDSAAAGSPSGSRDGVAAFTGLLHAVTASLAGVVDAGRAAAPEFLVRLHLELAARYFTALRRYAEDVHTAPLAWRVLFDRRADPAVPTAAFPVAGANAQLNLDLAAALVSTWEVVAPDEGGPGSAQYADYCRLNDLVEAAMDPLPGNPFADLVVRFTRDLAWDEAREVWTDGADDPRRRASAVKLDAIAGLLGTHLLG